MKPLAFYEFFAGGGMARAGLGKKWKCLFANDIDVKKAASYATNWGASHLKVADVGSLDTSALPGTADLSWASFPCQDLSLAGSYVGLQGKRSGTFWSFWSLMQNLAEVGRAPRVVVLENVCGALTSHGGRDFLAISEALTNGGYRFGAMVMDAVHFLPQSRPRLFIVAINRHYDFPDSFLRTGPSPLWHPERLTRAWRQLPEDAKDAWVWWELPDVCRREQALSDFIEEDPEGVDWHSAAETRRILAMMSAVNRKKVESAKQARRRMVGTIYKRTRESTTGEKMQRAEVRFDDIAGCLRTPAGGSSRQLIMVVDGNLVRSRLLSPREAARLMGLQDSYILPAKYNEAYHLCGDGVAVPVVRFLAANLLEPLIAKSIPAKQEAA